jgi:hypothetical protein
MAIFRGIGGAGDSTTDATVTAVTEQATNAASSASAASSSASAAATSASSAGTSASNAASSEAGVAASAASAAASAASATASKVAAAASETAAGASETAAAASESAAATSASNAASSASSASTSASTATTQASLATTNGAAQVALATTQATNSASSASTATTKASEAATSATNAGTSETNAASSASAAASSASSASASADAALTALDNFDDRYLGQKASDPTVDNDGNALIAGALYFNTTDSVMNVYEGSIWVAAYASLSGALVAANNLSDLASVVTSRTNLGLGTAATTAATDYATAAQGATADTAVQPNDTAAFSGLSYTGTLTGGTGVVNIGSGQVYKEASGNVGIGTSSPGAKLHVNGTFGVYSNSQTVPTPDNGSVPVFVINGNFSSGGGESSFWNAAAALSGGFRFAQVTGSGTYNNILYLEKNLTRFYSGGSERVRIDSAGNVGIGTSSPSSYGKFHVRSVQNITTYGNVSGSFSDGVTGSLYVQHSSGLVQLGSDTALSFGTGSSATERMRIDSAGSVGIGTSSPINKLQVSGAVAATGGAGGYSANMALLDVSGGNAQITAIGANTSTVGTLVFQAFSSNASLGGEKMRIDSSGNVGIGTAFPTEKLTVAGATRVFGGNAFNASGPVQAGNLYYGWEMYNVNSSTNYLQGYNRSTSAWMNNVYTALSHQWHTSGSEKMRIDSSGNLGIGTTTPTSGYKLNVGSTSAVLSLEGAAVTLFTSGGLTSNVGGVLNFRPQLGTTINDIFNLSICAYDHSGDQNADGLSINGADGVSFSTGGNSRNERMRIDSSGNVGIGTSSPAAKLDVSGAASATPVTNGIIRVLTTGSNPPTGYGGGLLFTQINSGGSNQNYASITGSRVNSTANNKVDLVFSTGDPTGSIAIAERMRIDTSGNVGIGKTPTNKTLELYASAATAIRIQNSTTGTGGGDGFLIEQSGADSLLVNYEVGNLKLYTSGSERMRIDSSGNVGIGTSSPGELLSLYKPSGDVAFRIQTSAGNCYVVNRASSTMDLLNAMNGPMTFATNNAERMRIDASGNVGIGTSSTTAVFTNYKSLYLNGSSGAAIQMQFGGNLASNIVADNNALYLQNISAISFNVGGTGTGTERARFDSSGNWYLGTAGANVPSSTRTGTAWGFGGGSNNYWMNAVNSTGAASHWFFVNGNGAVGGITTNGSSTAFNTSSDYRLKEDWVAVADASTRVNALKPVNFAWKVDGKRVDGFLAHELAEVVPEAVTGEKDAVDAEGNPEYQGIDQSKLVPLLTAALQEALAQIESLTARVSALEGN